MPNALANPQTRQFIKFALVGFASLAVDYCMLIALVEGFHANVLVGTSISFIVSVVVNYFLSVKYVFSSRDDMSRTREFTIFAVLSAIGLALTDVFMYVGVAFLSIGYQAMKLISTFMVTWYNYFSRRKFLNGGKA